MVGFKRRKNIKYKYGYCLNTEVVIPSSVRKGFGFYYVSALIAIGFSAAGCFGGGGESKTRYKKTSGITSSNSVATSWQVERSNLNENIETCKRTIEQYASNIAALEEEKRALNEINSMMQEDNFSRSYALSLRHEEEKRALLSQAEVLREELENNQNELYLAVENDLTTLHSSYEEKVNEWESVSSQLVALHEELDSKQNALKLAQEASAVDKKEISKLKSQFEITKSEYEKALSDLDVRAGEIHQLESEIKQAGKELDQARCERDQSNQSLEELQLKLNSSNEINSMMHEDHSHRLNSAYSQLQDALNDKNKQLRLEKLKSWLIHQKISALGVGVAFRRWKEYQLENVLNEKESLLSELQSRGTESGQLVIDLQEVRNALEANKENYTALLNEKQKLQSDFDSLSGDYQLSQEFQSTLANGIADINSGIDGMVAKNEFRIISLESDNQGYYTDTVLKMEALSNENAYLMSELEIVKEEYNQNVLAKQFDIDHLNHVTDQLRNNEQKEHENIISLNAELQKIRDSRKELMDEISDYKKEKDILSENILKLIEDKDSADLQKEHLLSKLQNQLQVLEDEKNNLESNYQQVSHEAVILDNELKEIREQINISESNVEKLHHELEVKEAELNDKNAEILDVKTLFKKRIDELSAELTENKRLTILYTNASSLFMQKINLRRGYDAFKENYYVSRNESLQNRSKQMVQQLESEFNKKIDFIQLEKQNISSELDTIKARIADAEKNEERMQLDSTELTEQLAAKAEELNEKESQLQMLKVEYDESLKKVSERDTEIEQLLTERALLESSLRELDNGKNSEIEGLNTQVKSLSDEISEKNTKIATITGELESEKTLLSEQISKLNIEKEQLEQERDRLSSELESSKLANDNNVDHISNLEKDLAVKSSEIEQIRIEKDTLESSLKFLESGKNSEIENIITQVRSLSDEISEKNNQIDAITSELDSEKTKSHQEITTLNSRLEILNAEKDQLEEEKTKLGLELDTVKEALSDSRDREDRIQIYSAELKEQLASKQEGLREKESELETLKVHHHESLSKLEEKDAEIEQLLSERESLESTLKEIELSKGSEIEALTDNVKSIHEQLSKVSEELSERNASVDAITAELESEKARFNDELSKLNTDLALLMSGKEQLEKEKVEIGLQLEAIKGELLDSQKHGDIIQHLNDELTAQLASKFGELTEKDSELQVVQSKYDESIKKIEEKDSQIEQLLSIKESLESSYEALELNKKSEIETLNNEINNVKAQLNKINDEISEKNNQIDAITSELDSEKTKSHQEITSLNSRLETLNTEKDQLEVEKTKLGLELDTVKEKLSDSQDREDRIQIYSAELKEQLASKQEGLREKESELETLKVHHHESLSKLEEKDAEIEQLLSERESLESTLKEIELSKGSEIEALTDNVKRIHEQLSKVSDELSERNASVDAITAELESEKVRFNDELSKLNTDLALLMSGKEQLEKERDELLSDYQDSKAESEDYINQISSLEEHLTTKVSEIESLCDEIKQKDNEYTDKISRIESDKADISSQFDEAKRNVNELESFKNDLEKELAKRSEIFDAEINSLKLGLNEKEELLIQRIHGLKVEKEDYLEKIEKYQLEQKQYKAELQELQELEKKALEDVAKEIHNKELLKNDMQDKMSEIYEKISDLEKELVDKQSSIVDLTTNLTNTSSVAQDRLEELTKVKNDLASAYTEVDNLHSEMDAFKGSTDELGRLNTDLCKQLDTLTNQKMVLEEKINILSAENSDHQSEIESLENKISGLDISLKLKQEELEKLQPFLEELSELKDSYNNIQIEIDSLKSQNGTLENEKDELHSEIQSLEVGKALLESKILGLEVDIQHLQEKEEELAKIQELEEYYKEELNNQYKCIQEAEEKNNNYVKEIDDLNQELSSNHLKYEKLNEDYQIINSELENKNAQITTLSVKDVENKEKIDAIQNEKSKLENSLEDMRKEKDSLVTKIDALYVEKNQIEDRLSEKVIELEQNIEMLILERKRKDVRLSEVNILLEEKDQKLNEYSKHIQQFNNMIDDICKKETQLKADLRQALESDSKNKEVIEDLQENLTDASATIQATKHEHANMQSQFAMIEVEKINLNSELSSINVELRNNKKELDKNIAEVKVLTHALAEEHHKNSLVQQEKIRLEGQVANLEDDLSSLTIKHQMLKNEKENILCEYTILQAQYSSSAEEESRINEALNVSNKELAEYKIQLDEQVELANSYNSMKANAKEGAVTQLDEFDKLKKKKLKLEEYINKAEEDLSRYRLLLASQDSQNTGSQLNRQNGNGNLQIATSEKENLEGTISRLEKKKHQSEIELNKLNEVNANVEGEFNYYLDEMALSSKGLSQLSSKQEGLVLKNDQLTEQLNKIASEKHNLQEKLANSEKRLQENIENSNSIEIENKRLKESLDRAMTAIENHETLKHQSDENVSKLISTPIKFDTLAEEIDDMKRTLSSSLSLRRSSIGLEANKEIGSPEEGIHLLEEKNIELEESERRLSRSIENIHEKLQEVEKDAALLNHIETLKLKASPLKENKIDDSQIVEEKREGDKLDSSFNTEYDNCKKSYTALPDKMLQRALDNVDLNYFSAENLLDQAQKDLKVLSDQKKKVRKSIDTLKELSEGDKENYHASSSLIRSGIVVNAAMTGNAATPGMQTQGLISKAANADQRKNKGRLSDVSFVGSRRESLPLEKVMGSLDSDLNISQIPAKQDINALKNSQMLNDSPAMTIEDIKNLPTKSVDSSMVSDVKEQEAILNQKKAIDTKNALEDAGKVLQESNEVIKSTKVKYDLRPAYADPDYPLMNYLTKYYIARKKIFLENNEKGVLDNDYKPTQDKVDEKFEQIDTHFNNKETYKPFHGKDEGDRKVLLKKLRKHYIKPVDWISESNRKYYKMNYSRINSSDLLKTDALYLTRRDRFFQESKLKDKRRELLLNSNLNMEDFLALKKQLVKILIYNNGSVKYHEFGEKFKGIDLVKNSNDSELLSKQKQVDSFLEILSKFFELDGILNYFQSKSELVIAMYELTTNVHRAVRKIGAETFMPASMLFSNAQNLKTEMIPLVCELINEYKIINDDK